jgi:hypothetical protein
LIAGIELEEDLAELDHAALAHGGFLHSADELRGHVDLDLRDDIAGGRQLDLGLRRRDQRDLGDPHFGLEQPGFDHGRSDVPGRDARGADHRHRDEPANGPDRRRRGRPLVAVDPQRREVRGEAIVHVAAGPA